MTISLIVCIVGLIVWYIFSRPRFVDACLTEAGKWAFIIGLIFTLMRAGASSVGKLVE